MTEQQAATTFARAWNRLDPDGLIEVLASGATFASQRVFEELKGRDAIANYLARKMQTIAQSELHVFAELGEVTESFPGRPCVVIAQGDKDSIASAALFEVDGGHITRIDMCLAEILKPLRTASYPT